MNLKKLIPTAAFAFFAAATSFTVAPSTALAQSNGLGTLPPENGHDALLIIDMTGSMLAVEDAGYGMMTRFDSAKILAEDWLRALPTSNGAPENIPTDVSIWTFTGTGYKEYLPFTTDIDLAIKKLQDLQMDNPANTPLALTLCDLSETLRNKSNDDLFTRKHLYVATDGGENNTPMSNRCGGPWSDDLGGYPNYTENSWQWRVRNMLIEGDPQIEPTDINVTNGVIVNVDFVIGNTLGSAYSSSALSMAKDFSATDIAALDPAPKVNDQSAARAPGGYAAQSYSGVARSQDPTLDYEFLKGLVQATGGTFKKGTEVIVGGPQLKGDINKDGCVDRKDVQEFFRIVRSEDVSSAQVLAQCDVNADGAITVRDYLELRRAFGDGCNQ